MNWSTIEELLEILIIHYKGITNIPKTTTEYIKNHPKGCSRQVIKSRLNLSYTQFLSKVGLGKSPEEVRTNFTAKVLAKIESLGYSLVNSDNQEMFTYSILELVCNDCSTIEYKTVDSLLECTKGCTSCKSLNRPWYTREAELDELLKSIGITRLGEIPRNQREMLRIKHDCCGLEQYRPLVLLVNPPRTDNSNTCPNCVQSIKPRIVYNDIVFDSYFERDAYILLYSRYGSRITHHIKYKDLAPCTRQWTADFVLNGTIIEVSSFKPSSQGYSSYMSNIYEKQKWAKDSNIRFVFLNSINEINQFINKYDIV